MEPINYIKDGIARSTPATGPLSGADVLDFPPNREQKHLAKSPGAWPQEAKTGIDRFITPSRDEKTLCAVENAIALLDIARMRQPLLPDEVRMTLRQLRDVRVELLKEIG